MDIVQRQAGDVVILELHGKVTAEADLAALHDTLMTLADDGRSRVVVNLEHVSWIDSGGLGALIRAYYAFTRRSGHLRLCSPNPRVDEVLFTIDLRNIFDVHATEAEALASFISRWNAEGT